MEFYKLMLMISVCDWVFFLLFFFLFYDSTVCMTVTCEEKVS